MSWGINLDLNNVAIGGDTGYSGEQTRDIVTDAVNAVASVVADGRVREVEQYYLAQQEIERQEAAAEKRQIKRAWATGSTVAGLSAFLLVLYFLTKENH